jgi:hypothetical protein
MWRTHPGARLKANDLKSLNLGACKPPIRKASIKAPSGLRSITTHLDLPCTIRQTARELVSELRALSLEQWQP